MKNNSHCQKLFLSEKDFKENIIISVLNGISDEFFDIVLINPEHLMKRYSEEMDRDTSKELNKFDELLFPYFRKPSFLEKACCIRDEYATDFVRYYLRQEIIFTLLTEALDRGVECPHSDYNLIYRAFAMSMKIINKEYLPKSVKEAYNHLFYKVF